MAGLAPRPLSPTDRAECVFLDHRISAAGFNITGNPRTNMAEPPEKHRIEEGNRTITAIAHPEGEYIVPKITVSVKREHEKRASITEFKNEIPQSKGGGLGISEEARKEANEHLVRMKSEYFTQRPP